MPDIITIWLIILVFSSINVLVSNDQVMKETRVFATRGQMSVSGRQDDWSRPDRR